ncbi:nucleotide-diphospho-sugar transferase [Pelagophyceae sp. CCMP2097]|nr:nucleotide-diphospho-sugar transferase [Pelagophyceae sp. CCMP2097]
MRRAARAFVCAVAVCFLVNFSSLRYFGTSGGAPGSKQNVLCDRLRGSGEKEPCGECEPCEACEQCEECAAPPKAVYEAWVEVPFSSGKVKCAFVTLLQARATETQYAAFMESASRLRLAFQLEQEYPHLAFHEGDIPATHQEYVTSRVPWAQFHDVSGVWGKFQGVAAQIPDEAEWDAKDRSRGYKHMCRFYGTQIFDIVATLGYDVIMRVDDDVFLLNTLEYDPFRVVWDSGVVYAWGATDKESHFKTEQTFQPWVRKYCEYVDWGESAAATESRCLGVADRVIEEMYFNNVFASRVAFWQQPIVKKFLLDVDESHGIYTHRWGDAPIQSAAVRLFARGSLTAQGVVLKANGDRLLVRQLPKMEYAHFSTNNLIIDGVTGCLSCEKSGRYLTALVSASRVNRDYAGAGGVDWMLFAAPNKGPPPRPPVASMMTILEKSIPLHKAIWIDDIVSLGIDRVWASGASLAQLPIFAFLQLIERVGVQCDGAGHINMHIMVPAHCCCHLDLFRYEEAVSLILKQSVLKIVEGWMKSQGVGSAKGLSQGDGSSARLPVPNDALIKATEAAARHSSRRARNHDHASSGGLFSGLLGAAGLFAAEPATPPPQDAAQKRAAAAVEAAKDLVDAQRRHRLPLPFFP